MSERQADTYQTRARVILRGELEAEREDIIAEQVAIRWRLIRLCVEDAEAAAKRHDGSPAQAAAVAGKLADGLAKLLGLFPAPGKGSGGIDPIEALRDLLLVASGQDARPEAADAPPE